MVIFNSYVKLPEGIKDDVPKCSTGRVFFTISNLSIFDGEGPSPVNFDHYACDEGLILVQHEPAHGIIGSLMVKLE